MIEIYNETELHCTEIKHWDCTPEMLCPVAITEEQYELELENQYYKYGEGDCNNHEH